MVAPGEISGIIKESETFGNTYIWKEAPEVIRSFLFVLKLTTVRNDIVFLSEKYLFLAQF